MIKKDVLIFAALLTFASCSDTAVEVGTGNPFSSLGTQPTGYELAAAILMSQAFDFETADKFPMGTEVTKDCQTGGTFSEKLQGGTTANTSNLVGDLSFSTCSGSFLIGGQSRAETLTGNINVSSDVTQAGEVAQFSAALTVSGDLGFSMECNVQFNVTYASGNTEFSQVGSGQCIFHDAEGASITVSGSDLVPLRSQTPII